MKRDHGDPNDDCESRCLDASGAFLLSCCRKYTSRIVKNRDRGGPMMFAFGDGMLYELMGERFCLEEFGMVQAS
ncbi:hypothetical protein CDAR_102801 [Caerostris darwini]|uniref:Uncharacterized protein n=1 Tax=Caerostris darwini TaxID=1538125 RepID=A0AAV4Q0W8_9ARAC|nr:hypothetical protein CDAR_102801 [Caerostris darwini]